MCLHECTSDSVAKFENKFKFNKEVHEYIYGLKPTVVCKEEPDFIYDLRYYIFFLIQEENMVNEQERNLEQTLNWIKFIYLIHNQNFLGKNPI